ncbi:hypothetical protein [Flaviaesturariibacter amylovorans]|uniref:Uncharacterized protein n=1 Tax=Flaviaesturariibacter amylovorans TaxID=1084520 RepID=A0ABP8G423_9BACT
MSQEDEVTSAMAPGISWKDFWTWWVIEELITNELIVEIRNVATPMKLWHTEEPISTLTHQHNHHLCDFFDKH